MSATLTPGQLAYLAEMAAILTELPEQGEGVSRSDGLRTFVSISLDGRALGRFTQDETSWLLDIY